ncbi:MAG: glycosyltransferase family 39 protein, partial [Alphaproteobacteria bacterium]|nr:glycosyltransferase family 39 protein [Alphaproteobacteria bacterium]
MKPQSPVAARIKNNLSKPIVSEPYGWSSVVILVLSLLVLRIMVLAAEPWPLYGDEAQYWLWGQEFSFGYFSKPPMIAWVIRLTTLVFGDREFGVRLAAPIFQAGTALVLYAAAREWFRGEPRAGLIAHRTAMVYSLIPGVMVSSLVISTDSPLLFFWSLALFFTVRARRTNLWLDWLGLGGAIGLGLLSKFSMGLFVVSLLVVAGWVRTENSAEANPLRLRNLRLWSGLGLGLAIYSPNLVWNLT